MPLFAELVQKTLRQLRAATVKEGYLDLLLALFRAIHVRPLSAVAHTCMHVFTGPPFSRTVARFCLLKWPLFRTKGGTQH